MEKNNYYDQKKIGKQKAKVNEKVFLIEQKVYKT